ncbi:hypothetical protein C8R46DRAFT_1034717 [Mycena filopes]|nr:hypothetical protein C8R46DRAFT_1034717 [Mycena filopes]
MLVGSGRGLHGNGGAPPPSPRHGTFASWPSKSTVSEFLGHLLAYGFRCRAALNDNPEQLDHVWINPVRGRINIGFFPGSHAPHQAPGLQGIGTQAACARKRRVSREGKAGVVSDADKAKPRGLARLLRGSMMVLGCQCRSMKGGGHEGGMWCEVGMRTLSGNAQCRWNISYGLQRSVASNVVVSSLAAALSLRSVLSPGHGTAGCRRVDPN